MEVLNTHELTGSWTEKMRSLNLPESQVNQGEYGDCFFEAALSSMSQTAAGVEKKNHMIAAEVDGKYIVTFPGLPASHIAVTPSDLMNFKVNNWDLQDNILEIAFLKIDGVSATSTGNNAINIESPYPFSKDALEILTGDAVSVDTIGQSGASDASFGITSRENMEADISKSLLNDQPVTANTHSIPLDEQGLHLSPYYPNGGIYPLVGNHAFSVESIDRVNHTVNLRNPWGDMNGTPLQNAGTEYRGIKSLGGGRIAMPVDTFCKYFSQVNFSGKHQSTSAVEHAIADLDLAAKDVSKIHLSNGLAHLSNATSEGLYSLSNPLARGFLYLGDDVFNAFEKPSPSTIGRSAFDVALIFGNLYFWSKGGRNFNLLPMAAMMLSDCLYVDLSHKASRALTK